MARLQDFQTVTPTASDKLLVVQSQGQGLTTIGDFKSDKMDKANPTGTGALSLNRKSGTTTGTNSVAEGRNGTASGNFSHAEGDAATASGTQAHAEGYNNIASGASSHAEGSTNIASGAASYVGGYGNTANHLCQHVFGMYNLADTSTADATAKGNFIEIVGKGTTTNARSNARTLDWSGNEVLAGDLTIMGNKSLNTLITNLADVKIGVASIAGGSTLKITGSSGLCCATFNNNNPTCAFYGFSLMASVFRFKPTDSTDTRLSATRDASTGEITITNGSGSYATIVVVYW